MILQSNQEALRKVFTGRSLLTMAVSSFLGGVIVLGVYIWLGSLLDEWVTGMTAESGWPEWVQTVVEWLAILLSVGLGIFLWIPLFRLVAQLFILMIAENQIRKIAVDEFGIPDYASDISVWGSVIQMLRPIFHTVRFHILCIPVYIVLLFFGPLGLVGFWILDGRRLGREYFEVVAPYVFPREDRVPKWKEVSGTAWKWGILNSILLTIPLVNFFVPLFATYSMVYLLGSEKK